jgi:sugar O-acyltransferase (sialic acid O-acetyltransferase NeuD family)
MKELYIIGAGGFGREAADTAVAINQTNPTYTIAGFIDDNEALIGSVINGIKVLGTKEWLMEYSKKQKSDGGDTPHAIVAVAQPDIKKSIAIALNEYVRWETLIHPTAVISPFAEIGEGAIIQSYSLVSPNAILGRHVHVNVHSVVGHDANIGDYSSVMVGSGISGCVTIGEGSYIASGVSIIPGTSIGSESFVGAGSVVITNVKAGTRVFGNPAKRINM